MCTSCCFLSSRSRHTRLQGDWSSDVCSSDLDRWNRSVAGGELQDRLKHQSQPFEKNGSQGPHSLSVSLAEQRIEKEYFQRQPVITCRALIIKTIVIGLPKNLFGKFILGENNPFPLVQGQADINESQ